MRLPFVYTLVYIQILILIAKFEVYTTKTDEMIHKNVMIFPSITIPLRNKIHFQYLILFHTCQSFNKCITLNNDATSVILVSNQS